MKINSVTGPVEVSELGKTMMHEHFVFGYVGHSADASYGEYKQDDAYCIGVKMANRLKNLGFKTIVDPTASECGRDPVLLKRISEETGVNIFCSTGMYHEKWGGAGYWLERAEAVGTNVGDELYEMFTKDIKEGIGSSGVKASFLKIATGYGAITDYERIVFETAAKVQQEQQVPIMTHVHAGTMALEQAMLLKEAGADPKHTIIGHMGAIRNPEELLKILDLGFFVGFDRFGLQITGFPSDDVRKFLVSGLLMRGYEHQIIMAHDTVAYQLGRPRKYTPEIAEMRKDYHVGHLSEDVIPEMIASGIPEEKFKVIFEENPKAYFGF